MHFQASSKIYKRILIIPSAIGLSHLTRLILIALELQTHGAEIAFAFKENNQILKHYGFQFFAVSDAVITDFSSNVFAAFTPSLIEQCVKDELKAIETFKPDVIIGDFRLTAAISSQVKGIPYISVVNGYMTDYFNPVDVMISKEERSGKHKVASVATKAIQSAQKLSVATHFRTVAQKYKLNNLASLYDFLRGDLTLIADLPEFCYLENLPQNFRYIGPLIWEGFNHTVPDYSQEFNSSKKLIYATTGNTGKEKLIQLVIDAFGNDNSYEVILTTGAFIHSDSVTNISNIHVAEFLPGSEIMKQSQVVIHCGGNGTTYQALSQGTPAVAIPFNNDQNTNAWLIKKHKLGIPLSPSELTEKQLKLAVKQVFEDIEIQNNLQHFQELLAKTNAPKSAANEIMSFLTTLNYPRKGAKTTENCKGNKQLTLHDDWTNADISITEEDISAAFNEILKVFKEWVDLYQLGLAPDSTPSKSIFQKVVKFFIKENWQFAKLEAESKLRLVFKGKNGKWTCYARARDEQQQFVFYSLCPINAPENKRQALAEFIARANYGMIIGNFELDFIDGEIRYKTSIDVGDDTLTYELMKQAVYTNVMTMDTYQPAIMSVIYSDVSPEDAIKEIEG